MIPQATEQPSRRPKEPGWIPLKTWAEMFDPHVDWEKALDYANPKTKRTANTFHPADIDRRSNKDIWVWYQAPHPITGFRRPRFVRRANPSNAAGKAVSGTTVQAPENQAHDQATAESVQSKGRFSPASQAEGRA